MDAAQNFLIVQIYGATLDLVGGPSLHGSSSTDFQIPPPFFHSTQCFTVLSALEPHLRAVYQKNPKD